MPWLRAILRGQKIYARASESGTLEVENGRVEIRYKPNDGRRYDARADNLEIADPTPLPEETCGPANAVQKPNAADKGKPAARSSAKSASPAPGKIPEGSVIAYADGACSGNPGPAGLGVLLIDGPRRVEISEYLGEKTNNIAELTAVLRALDEADAQRPLTIYTDSQYTIGVVQKGWKAKANTDLVAKLKAVLAKRDKASGATLCYVRGHAGDPGNERADALAREAVSARKSRREVFPDKAP